MLFRKLMDSQKDFDEKVVLRLKEDYKKQYVKNTDSELKDMLRELSDSTFDSEKSAKRAFWLGPVGAMQHIAGRDREARRQAITEILKDRGMSPKDTDTKPMAHANPQVEAVHEENVKRLLEHYHEKYPHNPDGMLEWHIMKIMKDGITREEAEEELAKQHGTEWKTPPTEPEPATKTKHCPECGLIVPLDTKICPKCGKEQYYFGQT